LLKAGTALALGKKEDALKYFNKTLKTRLQAASVDVLIGLAQ
jgi:hypothetical protein